jgi:uncharacterized OsmC-like protein
LARSKLEAFSLRSALNGTLAATFAGCFTTTLWTTARSAQFDFADVQVEASGTVRKAESSYGFNEIVIHHNLPIASSRSGNLPSTS